MRYCPRSIATPTLLAITLFGTACSSAGQGGNSDDWVAAYDTLGDTIVVRTLAGSVWRDTAQLVSEVSIGVLNGPEEYIFGDVVSMAMADDGTIYVMDRQVPALRVYNADGSYRATFGREGGGPGEYKGPDGGLNVLSDGRILLRDPANSRIQVYSPEGEDLDTWPIRGNFNTSSRMIVDAHDRAHAIILLDPEASVRDWQTGLVQILPDGTPGDTLVAPDSGYEPPKIEAVFESEDGGTSVSLNGVPFSPDEDSRLSPMGYFLHGISTDYAITLLRTDAPALRIEKVYDPVPVAAGEKAEEEAFAIRNMRYTDPNWRWNGPSIPNIKPPYKAFYGGEDGTIWVQVSRPAAHRADTSYDPTDPQALPDEWHEPVVFDVFQEDGKYLGAVQAPGGFNPRWPQPIFTRDWVLAVIRDEFDVESVVRFRVELPGGRSPSAIEN